MSQSLRNRGPVIVRVVFLLLLQPLSHLAARCLPKGGALLGYYGDWFRTNHITGKRTARDTVPSHAAVCHPCPLNV